jgi:hypothetical protein
MGLTHLLIMKKRLLGLSRDYRTNRWEITCDCGKVFKPQTTMLRFQSVECPKCLKVETIDYNEK